MSASRSVPKRVLLIGLLFCLGGVLAIWEVIASALRSQLYLNLSVFLLPVGIGLLLGKPWGRLWADIWFVLGYLCCLAIAVMPFISQGNLQVRFFNHQVTGAAGIPYILGTTLFLAAFIGVLHKLLYTQRANEYFRKDGHGHPKGNR